MNTDLKSVSSEFSPDTLEKTVSFISMGSEVDTPPKISTDFQAAKQVFGHCTSPSLARAFKLYP